MCEKEDKDTTQEAQETYRFLGWSSTSRHNDKIKLVKYLSISTAFIPAFLFDPQVQGNDFYVDIHTYRSHPLHVQTSWYLTFDPHLFVLASSIGNELEGGCLKRYDVYVECMMKRDTWIYLEYIRIKENKAGMAIRNRFLYTWPPVYSLPRERKRVELVSQYQILPKGGEGVLKILY